LKKFDKYFVKFFQYKLCQKYFSTNIFPNFLTKFLSYFLIFLNKQIKSKILILIN